MQDFASLTSDQKSYILASMDTSTASTPVSYRLKDNRDSKSYWISKLRTDNSNPRGMISADGNKYQIWMTQNLDLDLETTPTNVAALTSKNTDLNSASGIYSTGYSTTNGVITWTPSTATVTDVANTSDQAYTPQSLDVGTSTYYYPGSTAGENGAQPASCVSNAADCEHWAAGNYYNWTAAVASNNSSAATTNYEQMFNSICPAGWRLPTGMTASNGYSDFNYLLVQQGVATNYVSSGNATWQSNGYFNIQSSPLYVLRSGTFGNGNLYEQNLSSLGHLWSNTSVDESLGYMLFYSSDGVFPNMGFYRVSGYPLHCLVR